MKSSTTEWSSRTAQTTIPPIRRALNAQCSLNIWVPRMNPAKMPIRPTYDVIESLAAGVAMVTATIAQARSAQTTNATDWPKDGHGARHQHTPITTAEINTVPWTDRAVTPAGPSG